MGMSFFNLALARTPGIVSVYGIVSHFGAIYLCCIIQVWARARLKKDIPMLTISFLLYITLERSVRVIC